MRPYNNLNSAEALRWLDIAEKLLTNRDLLGSKTFATRARDSHPRLEQPDQIIAIVDTLIAGEKQISNQNLDWYAILQLARHTHDSELIASQYQRLALLLNPNRNKFPFAEHAFKLVSEAWLVLSNPSRKFQFDNEFGNGSSSTHFNFIQQHYEPPPPQHSTNSTHFNFIQEHSEQMHQPLQQQQQFIPQFAQQPPLPQHLPPQTFNQQQRQSISAEPPPPLSQPEKPVLSSQAQQTFPRPQPEEPSGWSQSQLLNPFPKPMPPQPSNQPQLLPVHTSPQPRKQAENGSQQKGSNNINGQENGVNEGNVNNSVNIDESSSFWTACPYCFNMYEYPAAYIECTLRCQNCKRAFHAVRISAPPIRSEGKEDYICCWSFFPLGASVSHLERNKAGSSNWSPFSTMCVVPQGGNILNGGKSNNARKNAGPWIYIDDEEDTFVEFSSSDDSDEDWHGTRKKKKSSAKRKGSTAKNVKQLQVDKGKKVEMGNGNPEDGVVAQDGVAVSVPNVAVPNAAVGETSKKAPAVTTRKQPGRVAKDLTKLDLNVEFRNEAEERAAGTSGPNGAASRVEDNIEGTGFFEGLDEFLSTLPVLSVVGDDKVKVA